MKDNEFRLHADLNDYRVDGAGYVISTRDRLVVIGQAIVSLGEGLSGVTRDADIAEMLGSPAPAGELREEVAKTLRDRAAMLLEMAADLEAAQIDERGSPRVGWDAKHSHF